MKHDFCPPQCFITQCWTDAVDDPDFATGVEMDTYVYGKVAQWAADKQLELVEEYLDRYNQWAQCDIDELHDAMRPEAMTPKEKALSELASSVAAGDITPESGATIRLALEALPE
jgi:hypothetical protein